jgi:hypothetical protein
MGDVNEVAAKAAKIMGEMSAEDRKIIEAHLSGKGGKSRRMSEEEILLKRPHAIPGTLGFNEKSRKQEMDFQCTFETDGVRCETIERVATSDLHQVTMCEDHKKDQARAKKEANAARIKALLELHPELRDVKLPKKS